eukprot:TRINITY_DN64650_c0_g1_i1.p1 TRINITY_DN64650_c0_g1~~TRINITY_DN64650_c0_g1_i1.p1  ORF type:complete len:383 (+),score=111.93 TRINITY_DN64650_c0_g1_i1:77-1225(+)
MVTSLHRIACLLLLVFMAETAAATKVSRATSMASVSNDDDNDDDDDVEVALQVDDQCSAVTDSACSLSALQLQGRKQNEGDLDLEAVVTSHGQGSHDLSLEAFHRLKAESVLLQQQILSIYRNITALDSACNTSIEQIEQALGQSLKWDHRDSNSLLVQNSESNSHSLPPRATTMYNIIIYFDKEFAAIYKLRLTVVRKRYGIWNTLMANPAGPSGSEEDNEDDDVDREKDGKKDGEKAAAEEASNKRTEKDTKVEKVEKDDEDVKGEDEKETKEQEKGPEEDGDEEDDENKEQEQNFKLRKVAKAQLLDASDEKFSHYGARFKASLRKAQRDLVDASKKAAEIKRLVDWTVTRTEAWLKGDDVYDIPTYKEALMADTRANR